MPRKEEYTYSSVVTYFEAFGFHVVLSHFFFVKL